MCISRISSKAAISMLRNGFRSGRRGLKLLSLVALLCVITSCSVSINSDEKSKDGNSVKTGTSSDLTQAGVQKILQDQKAFIDFTAATVPLSEFGAATESDLRSVETPPDRLIALEVKGPKASIKLDANIIRAVAIASGDRVRTVFVFQFFKSAEDMFSELSKNSEILGLDQKRVADQIQYLKKYPQKSNTSAFNGEDTLGFSAGIEIDYDPASSKFVLQYNFRPGLSSDQ